MNWREIIDKSAAFLAAKAVPEAAVAAELLAARLLGVGRGLIVNSLDKAVGEKELEAMRRGLKRLVAGEPVQYVLGEWDFRSLTLKCDRRALIPRPETEELVSRALAYLKAANRESGKTSRPFVLDLGTGTGAIILSLAREYPGEAIFLGTDISAEALELAQENAALNGLKERVKFALADGLELFDEPECLDIIVSNPPYVTSAECKTLDKRVKDFEPLLALDGGERGLDFYERYLTDAMNLLKPGGAVFFEIGESQGAALKALMTDCGFSEIAIEKDFSGRDRYASARLL